MLVGVPRIGLAACDQDSDDGSPCQFSSTTTSISAPTVVNSGRMLNSGPAQVADMNETIHTFLKLDTKIPEVGELRTLAV